MLNSLLCCSRALHRQFELGTRHAVAQYSLEEAAVESLALGKIDQLVAGHAANVRTYLPCLGPIVFTVSRLSETSNAVSLSTVSAVDPAVPEGGLAPGTAVFATMLIFVLAIGRFVCVLSMLALVATRRFCLKEHKLTLNISSVLRMTRLYILVSLDIAWGVRGDRLGNFLKTP